MGDKSPKNTNKTKKQRAERKSVKATHGQQAVVADQKPM